MIFQYYIDTDMFYIELKKGVSTESEEVASGIVLDFNDNGEIIGIEIEDASKLIDLSRLEISSLPVTDLVLSKMIPTTESGFNKDVLTNAC